MATEADLRLLIRAISDDAGLKQMSSSVTKLGSDVQRANSQTGGLSQGFDISRESALRFAGALTGVNVGLSLAASAGQFIKDSLTGAIQAQAEAERTARSVAAAYGVQAEQFTRFASALSAGTGFTKVAILEAALSARTLSTNYGLAIDQTQKLITVSADLARVRGIGVAEAFERVQSAIRGEAEASEFLGLTLNATFLKNNALNGSLKSSFETMTDAQKAQVVYGEVLRQSANFSGLATGATGELTEAMNKANVAGANLSVTLGKLIEPAAHASILAAATGVNKLDQAIQDALKQQLALNDAMARGTGPQMLEKPFVPTPLPQAITSLAAIPDAVGQSLAAATQAAAGAIVPVQALDKAFTLVNETLQHTHRDLAQVAADIGDLQGRSATLSTILGALDVNDTGLRAQIAALQDLQAIDARINAQRAAAAIEQERAREREATKITDPRDAAGANAARQRSETLDQLIPAEQARAEALKAQADAQKQVSALELSAQQRQLAVAQPLADLRTETLLREVQIAEVQQKEADLAERITLASRQNLDLVRQSAQAKLDALPAAEALNDNSFEAQQLRLENKAIRADVRRGVLDRSALDDIRPNRQRITELRREAPRLESDAFNAARAGELIDRQATREQLDQTIKLSILEQQKRVLDDQLTPLRQAQTLTDARTAAIQRQLELAQLGETSARTAAAQQLLSANQAVTAADALVQKSIEWASNIGAGLQNITRAAQELSTMPQPTVAPWPATPGVPPGGFVSPTSAGPNTTTITVTNNFTGPVNDPQAIAHEVLTALDHAFDSAPKASSTGLAGAI